MALVVFGDVVFDADLVVFDKDGTLLDFEFMWGRLIEAWVERLAAVRGDDSLPKAIVEALGYDLERHRTRPESPLSIATTEQVQTIVAATLYRHGVGWSEAESLSSSLYERTLADLSLADLIRTAGDVVGLMTQLRKNDVHVAVITTDHRAETEETLHILQVDHLIEILYCGDDGIPWKPAPDTFLATCEQLRVSPGRAVMVGDTLADLLMGQRASAGLKVGVLSGAGDPALLQRHADIVLRSIDEIKVKIPKSA
ncbi:MAG: HAD family hydrolase [Anaerolineae bacterium]|nr:HAD family hydrolase [Anaerolineae bacterium]